MSQTYAAVDGSGDQFTDADLAEWDEGMRAATRQGGLVYALTFLVVAGRRVVNGVRVEREYRRSAA